MAAAALTFIVTRDVRSTIAVIIVAGACGVAAGTPLAILGAIGRAARSGAIIKGGIHLEALWSIDTVVLDKTGTLTFGGVRVNAVYPAARVSVREVLEAAAIAECRSEHPIGRAIIKYAAEKRIPQHEPTRFTSTPGQGVRALYGSEEILVGNSGFVTAGRLPEPPGDAAGSTTVFVVRGGQYLGFCGDRRCAASGGGTSHCRAEGVGGQDLFAHRRFSTGNRAHRSRSGGG